MTEITVKTDVLENGLRLLGEPNPASKSASIGFFVKTGARDEDPQESGISHFLEHMMFKGTEKRSAMDITLELGTLGVQANAYTSEESTVFYGAVIPEYFQKFQELLSDMLRPALVQEEFDMEKKVILEEIALYQDRPHFYLFENALRDYYGGHPAGNSVLGTVESVSGITREMMVNYFKRRYLPSNIILCASGNFDWQRFKEDSQKLCGSWEKGQAGRDVTGFKPSSIQKVYYKEGLSRCHVLLMTAGPSVSDDERYAFTLLSVITGDSSGSRLYWQLIDSGIADGAGADNDEREGTGCFMLYASTGGENLDKVSEVLRKIAATPLEFSEDDLNRAKAKLISRIVKSGELPLGRLMALGNEWLYRQKKHSLKETIERIKAVSQRDIQAAVEKFGLNTWSEFRLLPEE
ncbi:MAG: insulinase family protein [Candidatus Dadabacteria bacterium]|nr:MAG: insulinase family protein [Candidatus Dadabacteria bacterium]